jgi:RES domain-containing protein
MLSAWRLVKTRYAATAFDGEGARLYGARWNSPGIRVAYASSTIALAILEVVVHLVRPATATAYSLANVEFPESLVDVLKASALPRHWDDSPPPQAVLDLGDRWVNEARSAVLQVPSAIIPAEHNYLLNPKHRDFAKVTIVPPKPFKLDQRLVGP